MIASFRAETLKSRKRAANWILFGILLAILLLLGYVLGYVILSNPPKRFESPIPAKVLIRETFPENLLPTVLNNASTFGAAIMIIFGALSTASEFGWLTVQTILVQKPGRTAVLAGKLLSLAIVALLVSIALLGSAALISDVLVTINGSSSSWPSTTGLLKGFAALWFELSVWTAFGMFFGMLFRSAAGAIGGGLTYLFVGETLLGRLLRDNEAAQEILKFLPGVNADAINSTFAFTFRNPNAAAPLVSAERGLITLAVWLAAFVILSILLFRYRDVTGG